MVNPLSINMLVTIQLCHYTWAVFICDEENQILRFLQSSPETFFSASEVCRKAGSKKLFTEDPHWAFPFLSSLTDKKLVERDDHGHFKIRSDSRA